MKNQKEILRFQKIAGLLTESQIYELGMKDLGIGAAMAAGSLFGSPQVKAQEPQQIVQQASDDLNITDPKAAKNLNKQGYEPLVGGMPIETQISKLQDMLAKGFKVVQGKAVGSNQSAAQAAAFFKGKAKIQGQVIPTNVVLKRILDNGNTEVVVFLASK